VTKKTKNSQIIGLIKNFEMASSLGFSIAIPISLGTILGAFLDVKTGSKPLFTLAFLSLGLGASIYTGYKIIKKTLLK
jgi:F0F1-type ATP synthase assembly protein I